MSDFIYSKNPIFKGKLTKEIQAIYHEEKPAISEFHGSWGSLAVSYNIYNGFQPYETNEHVCIVLGGPVLCYQDNNFLTSDDEVAGARAIYNRWIAGTMQWDEDLSGPFAVLILNKSTSEINCITDLMSFIPVFIYQDTSNMMLSTHVNALAQASGQHNKIDIVSQVDFILHGVVTFPFTTYTNLRQVAPAEVHSMLGDSKQSQSNAYWVPKEKFQYKSIDQAAMNLRDGLQNYIDAIVKGMPHLAQFISGGEDSRTLSGLLPKECNRDAFIFLDGMNREGKVAKKAANAYGVNFNMSTRSKIHYLEILPCADLVGKGSQYIHAHTFGFHKSCKLNEYPAVFGGLFSDALLKGARIKKLRGLSRFPFLPQIKRRNYSAATPLKNDSFQLEVLEELTKRRQAHLKYVSSFRNESAEEWFELWPSSMNMNIPNLHANRRLFKSYEPFLSKDVVKISASIPQKWKLNRRVFHKAAKPLLKPTKWLLHGEGRLPYFPWYINSFVQFVTWTYRQVGSRSGIIKGNQGPWGQWKVVMNSAEWDQAIDKYSDGLNIMNSAFKEKDVKKLFEDDNLNYIQRVNLMQTLYMNHKKEN
ncbi:hypothetical protein RJD24_02535 [Bacillaceae bacterium IKA-2]|nr:hypothetical protein RJD24_02535 [Bacillaceae bacterium IKA-2]